MGFRNVLVVFVVRDSREGAALMELPVDFGTGSLDCTGNRDGLGRAEGLELLV